MSPPTMGPLKVMDGILWQTYEAEDGHSHTLQLIIPKKHRKEIIQELHDGIMGGHLGPEKTHSRLKQRFYWSDYWNDVKTYCISCTRCAIRKSETHRRRAPLQPVCTGYPLEVVAVDNTGPFPESERGNCYVLVVGDYFTKWAETYTLPDQEAATVSQKLVDEFFCRFSVPQHFIQTRVSSLNLN